MVSAATEKACFWQKHVIQLSCREKRLFGNGRSKDPRYISRLTKYVGC